VNLYSIKEVVEEIADEEEEEEEGNGLG